MILEVYKNAGDDKPRAVFGGGAFDFEYMNETLIINTQRATRKFGCKHLSIFQGRARAYEEWESNPEPEGDEACLW